MSTADAMGRLVMTCDGAALGEVVGVRTDALGTEIRALRVSLNPGVVNDLGVSQLIARYTIEISMDEVVIYGDPLVLDATLREVECREGRFPT